MTEPQSKLTFISARDVHTRAIHWLVDNWIPLDTLTILGGLPGLGKSTIAADIAAKVTDGTYGEPGNILYMVTEDDLSSTVKPRLKVAGADLDKVKFHRVVLDFGDGVSDIPGSLQFPAMLDQLRDLIVKNSITFIVMDAIKSMMASSDSNNEMLVRKFLEPLTQLAQDTHCTILGIAHLTKGGGGDANMRLSGSSAWLQVPRSYLAVALDKGTDELNIWNSKGNLATEIVRYTGKIKPQQFLSDDGEESTVGRFVLGERQDGSGDHLLAEYDSDERSETHSEVVDFLLEYFENSDNKGWHNTSSVKKLAAKECDVSTKTVQRAFGKIGGVMKYTKTSPPTPMWAVKGISEVISEEGTVIVTPFISQASEDTPHVSAVTEVLPVEIPEKCSRKDRRDRKDTRQATSDSPQSVPAVPATGQDLMGSVHPRQFKDRSVHPTDNPEQKSLTRDDWTLEQELIIKTLEPGPLDNVSLIRRYKENGGKSTNFNTPLEQLRRIEKVLCDKDTGMFRLAEGVS